MIAMTDELRAASALVDLEMSRARERGQRLPAKLELGAMLEVPSLLWQLPDLLRLADFISVGSNDLAQFLFASDRGNPRLAGRYDSLSPAMLSVIAQLVAHCAEAGRPISVCGEMAGRPLEAFALVALGFERLSMPPAGVGPVKQMVLSCDREAARRGVSALLKSGAGSVRNEIETLARKTSVAI
jgi:phosphotransferase system, enzyme I, PtsP